MKSIWFYEYPIGKVVIAEDDGMISHIVFDDRDARVVGCDQCETPLIKNTATQLYEYFQGKRKNFDVPLSPKGTLFQRSVWNELQLIKFGQTCSYKDVAISLGNQNAARAVGLANNRNPISIIIPCHRVVGKSGSLVGYAGGLNTKKYLLDLEKGQ